MFIESPMGLWNVDYITIKGGSNSYLKLGPLTTTQRDALDAKNGTMIYNSTTGVINSYEGDSWGAIGSGDIVGPATSTNNAVARFDLATGKLLQNSGIIINDTDDISGVHGLTSTAHIDLGSSWDFRAHNLTADALTASRLVYTGASGLLSAAAAGTWDGATLGIDGAAVFNNSEADKDFRVGSSGITYAIFAQGSNGFVGIGTVPASPLHISNASIPVRCDRTTATVNSHLAAFELRAVSNGDMVDGFGPSMLFTANDDTVTALTIFGRIVGRRDSADTEGKLSFFAGTGGAEEFMTIDHLGNTGIATTAPGQILDCNSGSGNMIADGYDSHPSTYAFKENQAEVSTSGMIDKLKSFKLFEFTKKPFVSADELRIATIKHFSQARWVKAFGGEVVEDEDGAKTIQGDAYRQGKLRTCPDEGMLEFIDAHAEGLREERRGLPQWSRKHLGPILDSPGTQEALGDVIHYDEEGNISGYGFTDQVGFLEGCIRELVDRVEILEATQGGRNV